MSVSIQGVLRTFASSGLSRGGGGLTGGVMTITTQEFPRQAWRSYFEELTDVLGTVEATVEVVGRDLGDRFATSGRS